MSERVIPDQTLATNMRKTLMTLCDVVDGWQKKCADLQAKLEEKDRIIAALKRSISEEERKQYAGGYADIYPLYVEPDINKILASRSQEAQKGETE